MMTGRTQRAFLLLMVLVLDALIASSIGIAQGTTAKNPLQPSDTSSPRATLHSFIDACNELYELTATEQTDDEINAKVLPAAERIRDCLDLSALPGELRDTVGVESAVYLKEVLDRIELPDEEEIPGAPDAETEAIERWRIPATRITIARVEDGPNRGAYLFTPDTVRQASKFFSAAKRLPYRSDGPRVSAGFSDRYSALTRRQPILTADTSSPRGTLTLFLDSVDKVFEKIRTEEYFDRSDSKLHSDALQIYRCLDLSEVPEFAREYYASEVSAYLKEVLDRVPLPPAESIPGPEDLQAIEGGEPLAQWQIPNTKITIGRVTEGSRRGEYLFTPSTVASARAMYQNVKQQPYRTDGRTVTAGLLEWYLSAPGNAQVARWVSRLPDRFRQRWFGLALWQWIGLSLASVLSLSMMIAIYWIGAVRSEKMQETSLLRYWLTMFYPTSALLIPLAFKLVVLNFLTIRGNALYATEFAANLTFLLSLIIVILALSSRLAHSVVALPKTGSRTLDATLVQILFRALGIIAAAAVFLEGGQYLGFPLTTLLASAGIGGLAIALSAQGMIKGLFGTVTVLLDRPYRVGERIRVNDKDGIVEEVGLRSTKIREFLTNHVICIPNDQMADAQIENIGKRKHIRRMTDLHIPIDTAREKVEAAANTIREILKDHEGMDPEYPPRVYFNEFNPDSFNIHIIYWYTPPNLWEFLAFSEKLNLQIFKAFEEQGIQFSLPLRHSYWKKDDEQGPLEITIAGDTMRIDSKTTEPAIRAPVGQGEIRRVDA